MSTKRRSKQKKKKKSLKSKLINIFLFLMLLVGLALVFNNQIKNFLVKWMSEQDRVENVSREDIIKNLGKKASFDFDAVESLDFNTVAKAKLYQDDLYVIGGIAIPSVNLNLPIYKGVSNYAISVGAGTMREDQKMGIGNYPLASHHMIQESLLFGPLVNINYEAKMYITDLEHIYEYEVDFKEYVEPTRSDLIEDKDEKKQLTLVTCDYTGAQRLIVQGKLTRKLSTKKATKDMTNAFNLPRNS